MKIPRTFLNISPLSIGVLGISLVTTIGVAPSTIAQTTANDLQFNTTPNLFESEGRPPSRTSAGSRDSCLAQVVALLPGQAEIVSGENECGGESETLIGLTTSAQPTLWFYIPALPQAGMTAEFALLDELQRAIAIQSVSLNNESGIIGVQLNQPLEIGVMHRWIFSLESAAGQPSQNVFVEGLIKRVEPDQSLSSALAAATSDSEKVRLYADQGIWHDALTLLINLHQTAPSDLGIRNDWSSFLESVGLGAIAQAPILDCCLSTSSP